MIENITPESTLINDKLKKDLTPIFDKLAEEIVLRAVVDMESEKGKELAGFLAAIASMSEKLHLEAYSVAETDAALELNRDYLPVVGLYKNGKYSGAAFHGVPGGQEINSFVLAIYNLGGPGQEISRWTVKKIEKLSGKTNIKICVSLACHYCPKVVAACQRLAILNDDIEAEMIDATLYQELVEKYKIERIPLIIINDKDVYIGQKTLEEMIDIVKKTTKK